MKAKQAANKDRENRFKSKPKRPRSSIGARKDTTNQALTRSRGAARQTEETSAGYDALPQPPAIIADESEGSRRNTANGKNRSRSTGAASQVWTHLAAFLSRKSKNTQVTYAGILAEWSRFLGAEPGSLEAGGLILEATTLHAARFLRIQEGKQGQRPRMQSSTGSNTGRAVSTERLKRRPADGLQSTLSNSTITKKGSALRRLYRVLIGAELGLNKNPFDADAVAVKGGQSGQKRPTEMLPFEAVSAVLELPQLEEPKGRRDQVIMALLFGGGLRRSEVVKLRLGDIRISDGGTTFLYLRSTKAQKDAQQALPDWAAQIIWPWVDERQKSGAEEGDYLIVSYRGKGGRTPTNYPLSPSGLYRLFRSYVEQVVDGGRFSPHSARATAITKLLSDGLSHREVQEFSRHASVLMVESYDKRRFGVDSSPARQLSFGKPKKAG